jgi:hypothetical protein
MMWWKRCAPSSLSSTRSTRCFCVRRRERRDGRLREDVADDRRRLEHGPLRALQRVEA